VADAHVPKTPTQYREHKRGNNRPVFAVSVEYFVECCFYTCLRVHVVTLHALLAVMF
jgi:hypothetical protein